MPAAALKNIGTGIKIRTDAPRRQGAAAPPPKGFIPALRIDAG